jgi:AraC-like DNA-binding protein
MMKPILQHFYKRTVACHVVAALFVSTIAFSQENGEEKILLVKANELVFSNPDETIKIANHLLKKNASEENIAILDILLANSYKAKGDYQKAVSYIFEASENSKKTNDSLKAEIALVKADLSRKLHLYKQMEGYLSKSHSIISDSGNKDYVLSFEIRGDIERIYAHLERKQYAAALKIAERSEKKNKSIDSKSHNSNPELELAKAQVLKSLHKTGDSEKSFNQAFTYYKSQNKSNTILEIKIFLGLGQLYFEAKNFEKAIDVLFLAQKKAEKLGNAPIKEAIAYQLAENYFAMGNEAEYQKYFGNFIALNTANLDMESEAVNSMYNLISNEQEANYVYEQSGLMSFAYSSFACLVLIVVSGLVLYRINKAKRKQLKEIIGYLEVTNKLLVKSGSDKKEINKKITTIPTETEQVILAKLKKFEVSTKYTHKDMSLATLAAQLDVNTKYLSEIINKHYHDNFNTYINRLRINYIIEKLKNEPEYLNYKISYLAEESGFSSHSSFATVFKSITGIAPTVFIDLIGKEVTQKKA